MTGIGLSRYRLFALGFFAAIAAGTAAAAQQPADWDSCSGRNYPGVEQRIKACTAIIETDGVAPADQARALGFRGVAYANKGDTAAASRDYDESLRLDATSSSGHRFRGNKYMLEKNLDDALAEYDEAVRLDPTSAFAYTNRGGIYTAKKDYDRAIAEYGEAIRLDPDWALSYYGRGRAYQATKDYDRAIADYDAAVRLNPKFVLALVGRGTARQAKGDITAAITDYDQALLLDPKSVAALYNRGSAHHAAKDEDAAIADLSEAIRLNPRYSGSYVIRGLAFRAKGDNTSAIVDLDQAIQLDPASPAAFYDRATVRHAQRNYDGAAADYSEAIRLDPKLVLALVGRGQIHGQKREFSQAIADYDAAIKIDPTVAAAWASRCGDRIADGQDLQVALADCNEALRLQPHQVLASLHRGYIDLKLGNTNDAIADFDAALTGDPKNVFALYGRGLTEWKSGQVLAAETDVGAARRNRFEITNAVTKYYGVPTDQLLLLRLALIDTQDHPMIFAVAHGDADACGPGCNEWIVADGQFEAGVDKRFARFLDTLGSRKPPIFFNSGGGILSTSLAIGRMLRERQMTTGLGITVADDCHATNPMDESCRSLLRTSQPLKARLRTAGAVCFSACVYALMGGSVRQVAQGAFVGVHAPLLQDQQIKQGQAAAAALSGQDHAARRQYAKQMGVDPDLIELTDQTPYISLHVLTRDELARYQIETPSRSGRSENAPQSVPQKGNPGNQQDAADGL